MSDQPVAEKAVSHMSRSTLLGLFVSAVVLSISLLIAGIALTYLTEYGGRRVVVAVSAATAGILAAVIVHLLVSRHCRSRRGTATMVSLLLVFVLVPLLSTVWPGRVSYSRFGLTVFGFIPVPVLDITVGSHGGLWFRDKSHFVSIEEVRSLMAPEVQVVVIGTGWNGAVTVDSAVRNLEGCEIHVLPTPRAFDLFNRCVSEGTKAVLIAHSTC
jgi:hypothetical protein